MLCKFTRRNQDLSHKSRAAFSSVLSKMARVWLLLRFQNLAKCRRLPQGLPPLTPSTAGSAGDDIFVRQAGVYIIFPSSTLESSRPSPFFAFTPLLLTWLESEKRRSRFRIYVEILDVLKQGPMTPYEVSFYLRLNSKRTRNYIEFLIRKEFLERTEQGERSVYEITPAGKTFLENLKTALEGDKLG